MRYCVSTAAGLAPPDAKEAAIARPLIAGWQTAFVQQSTLARVARILHDRRSCHHHRIFGWQTIQDAQAITLKRRSDAGGIKSKYYCLSTRNKNVAAKPPRLKRKRTAAQRAPGTGIKGDRRDNPTPVPLE